MNPLNDELFDDDHLREQIKKLDKMSREEQAKWAGRVLKKLDMIIADPNLSEEQRQGLEETFSVSRAQLAGLALSVWLPFGTPRKIIMLICLIVGVYNVFMGNLWYLLLLVVVAFFSPRLLGELSTLIGEFQRIHPGKK